MVVLLRVQVSPVPQRTPCRQNYPIYTVLEHNKLIQEQVEERIRQLSNSDKKGTDPRIKSQRGASVDIFVKEKIKWPHEYVLAGTTKDRVTYNQLNITQFMAGFCRIMREESCQITKDHMLDYLISLLDDSNDFSWQAAKASHAVLLCRMEQGEVTSWSQTDKIDRIHRANAQKHLPPSQSGHSNQKFKKNASGQKSMPCVFFNDKSCNYSKHHETKRLFIGTFVVLALPRMGRLVHTVLLIVNRNKKTINPEHGH